VRYESDSKISPSSVETARAFPCPECAPKVDHERIALVYSEVQASAQYSAEPEYQAAILRDAAHAIVDELLRGGYIKQVVGDLDNMSMSNPIRCTLGVVSPSVVATMEARIAERQGEVADRVAEEAKRLIGVWGSHYGHTTLTKDQACRSVSEALDAIKLKMKQK
jgi:hypothetical protein